MSDKFVTSLSFPSSLLRVVNKLFRLVSDLLQDVRSLDEQATAKCYSFVKHERVNQCSVKIQRFSPGTPVSFHAHKKLTRCWFR